MAHLSNVVSQTQLVAFWRYLVATRMKSRISTGYADSRPLRQIQKAMHRELHGFFLGAYESIASKLNTRPKVRVLCAATVLCQPPSDWALPLAHIHPIKRMAAKGAEFEVDYFFAYRLELHRVGDSEPGRLLFEYHLGLFVQLGAFGDAGDDFGFAHDVFIGLVAKLGDIGAIGFSRVAA